MSTPLNPNSDPTLQQVNAWGAVAVKHNYFERILTSLDQTVNVFVGGDLDETVSAHVSRVVRSKQPENVVGKKLSSGLLWILDKIQKLHGVKAESGDLARAIVIVNTERSNLGLPSINLLS